MNSGGTDLHLNCAELRAFDLPWDRAKLACRIKLDLDASAGILFQCRGEVLRPFVGNVVDSGRRNLHHIVLLGLLLRTRRTN